MHLSGSLPLVWVQEHCFPPSFILLEEKKVWCNPDRSLLAKSGYINVVVLSAKLPLPVSPRQQAVPGGTCGGSVCLCAGERNSPLRGEFPFSKLGFAPA